MRAEIEFIMLVLTIGINNIQSTLADLKMTQVTQEYAASNRQAEPEEYESLYEMFPDEEDILPETEDFTEETISADESVEDSGEEPTEAVKPFLNTAPGKPVILDVDMSTDVDDVCAVRMADSMDTAGLIDLKAVMCCVTGENNIPAVRGLLLYDGKPDVKIGTCSIEEPDISPYWDILASYDDGGGDVDTAVRQYRKILSETEEPVDIVVTGFATNLEYLLKSGPDDISPLSGQELVKDKVGQLYIVGGAYPEGFNNNFHFTTAARQAIDYVNKNWGKPIIFEPAQTGGLLTCGAALQAEDTERSDIVTKSLDAFGTSTGRTAWDPFCVWICGLGCSDETQIRLEQCDLLTSSGSETSTFLPSPSGMHFVVHLASDDVNYYNSQMDAWL